MARDDLRIESLSAQVEPVDGEFQVRVLHVITGLGRGGAQTQLSQLVGSGAQEGMVFSICEGGKVREELEAKGIRVCSGGTQRLASWRWLYPYKHVLKDYRPDVVLGWMYHGNLAACLAKVSTNPPPIVWNIRHSVSDLTLEKTSTRWVIRAGRLLSPLPAHIIYNSYTAAKQHRELGYSGDSQVIIPNGFDTERFRFDSDARSVVREELGVPQMARLVGVVGRAHPMKNHEGFVRAMERVASVLPDVRAVIVGPGVGARDGGLLEQVKAAGLGDVVSLLSETSEPERLYPALDLLVIPSWGEGFPNVAGEAMCCEVPCLVTDVGDAARVVGDTGFVVSSGAPDILADSLLRALSLDACKLHVLGRLARKRVERYYTIEVVAKEYERVLQNVVTNSALH